VPPTVRDGSVVVAARNAANASRADGEASAVHVTRRPEAGGDEEHVEEDDHDDRDDQPQDEKGHTFLPESGCSA
jgi:hypothetical protein